MKLPRFASLTSLALVGTLSLAACGSSDSADPADTNDATATVSGTLNGAGATSQQAAMQAWQAAFATANPDATVNYAAEGSGAGRTKFVAGAVDFAGSDAYLADEELAEAEKLCGAGKVVELPNYVSPIAVAFNLPGVDKLQLKPATIAGIFAGKITTWNDAAIAADNPGVTLPSTAITPVHRSDESGTTQNFTDYLNKAAGDVWTSEADQEWPIKGGEAAQGTSGVVAAIKAGEGAIGYADASQVAGLGTVAVGVGSEFVEYSAEAAAKILTVSTPVAGRGEYDLAIDLARDTTESGTYPIVLVSYHIACHSPEKNGDLLKSFLTYVISEQGQQDAATNAGSAPLSAAQRSKAEAVVSSMGM